MNHTEVELDVKMIHSERSDVVIHDAAGG